MTFVFPKSARSGGIPSYVYGIVGVVAFLAVIFFLARGSGPSDTGLVLYWGIGCPHCIKVEEYLQANKVDEKIQITRKEVYQNQKNAYEMSKRAGECGLPTGTVAVPFLWTGKTCLIGDIDIIKFFWDAMSAASSSAEK